MREIRIAPPTKLATAVEGKEPQLVPERVLALSRCRTFQDKLIVRQKTCEM